MNDGITHYMIEGYNEGPTPLPKILLDAGYSVSDAPHLAAYMAKRFHADLDYSTDIVVHLYTGSLNSPTCSFDIEVRTTFDFLAKDITATTR